MVRSLECTSYRRPRQRRKGNSSKRHPQPRPNHIQIRRQTRHSRRDQTLETRIRQPIHGSKSIKPPNTIHSKPSPTHNHDAKENRNKNIQRPVFIREKRRDDPSRDPDAVYNYHEGCGGGVRKADGFDAIGRDVVEGEVDVPEDAEEAGDEEDEDGFAEGEPVDHGAG